MILYQLVSTKSQYLIKSSTNYIIILLHFIRTLFISILKYSLLVDKISINNSYNCKIAKLLLVQDYCSVYENKLKLAVRLESYSEDLDFSYDLSLFIIC